MLNVPALRLSLCIVFVASAISLHAAQPQAPVLLRVDETDPSAVSFTFTGLTPSTSTSAYTFYDGVDLENFFTTDNETLGSAAATTTLSTGDTSTGPLFNSVTYDNVSTGDPNTNLDLNLYDASSADDGNTMSFDSSLPAFTGTAVFDLTGFALRPSGFIGTLDAGYSGDASVTPIGAYEIISAPEPSTYAMFGLSLAGLMFFARRKLA